MPYDPTYPALDAEMTASGLRDQFHGVKDLIDAVPAGPPGPPGEVTTAQLNEAIQPLAAQITALQSQVATLQNGLDYCTRNLPNYRSQQVGTLTLTLSDPPTLAEAQAIVDKLNAYIIALSTEA